VERGFGDAVTVAEVKNTAGGTRMVRDGTAEGSVAVTSPTTLRLEYAGAKGVSESC